MPLSKEPRKGHDQSRGHSGKTNVLGVRDMESGLAPAQRASLAAERLASKTRASLFVLINSHLSIVHLAGQWPTTRRRRAALRTGFFERKAHFRRKAARG